MVFKKEISPGEALKSPMRYELELYAVYVLRMMGDCILEAE